MSHYINPVSHQSCMKGSLRSRRVTKSTYLSVIGGTSSKQGMKRVVAWDEETSKVDQELASDVEEDEEEVDANETQDDIDLRDGGLSLQVVQGGILGELIIFFLFLRQQKSSYPWPFSERGIPFPRQASRAGSFKE